MNKPRRLESREDRSLDYRDWRRTFKSSSYVMDMDQVEYRIVDGEFIPVAVIELTREDHPPVRSAVALQTAVLHRISEENIQAKALVSMAERLGVNAFLVLFVADLSEFHVYNLSTENGWWVMNRERYQYWIDGLSPSANTKRTCGSCDA